MNSRFAGLSKFVTVFVVVALIAALFLVFATGGATANTLTADFKGANSLYTGGDVRILGVTVGKVTDVVAMGDRVRVTMELDGTVKVPADAKAVEVSPAIVGDRFVQLAPAYTSGPVLEDGGHIALANTAVPIELDDIFKSVDNLALALGPEGANKDGSLSRLVKTTANQLDGQGQELADTLTNFSKLSTTLNNNQDALFSTIDEVNKVVALLNKNDEDVRQFFDSTAEVSDMLAGEREDLADTIEALSDALLATRDFVKANRSALRGNVDNLERLALLLANHSEDIDHLLTEAPISLAALGAAGAGKTGSLDARTDLVEIISKYHLPTDATALLNLLGAAGTPLTDIVCSLPLSLPVLCPVVPSGAAAAAGAPAPTARAAAVPPSAAGATVAAPTPAAPELVPGLDDAIQNLAGMLGVQ